MDKKFYFSIVAGLVLVGVLLVIAEYISSKLGCPESDSSEDEGGFYSKKPGRFSGGAKIIFGFAALMAMVLAVTPDFEEFPSNESISKFVEIILYRVDLPWGNISVLAAGIGVGVATFLVFAGIEHWRRRRAYARACLCFALGLIILLQALFQWA
jgi:hypothetical protein